MTDQAKHFSIVMAYDAFRLCIGKKPKHFTPQQILLWVKLMVQAHET